MIMIMIKPEAATAVIELPMMGGETPETCWAVNKRQDNRLESGCIWLVIYLNCTMMQGLSNLKSIIGRYKIRIVVHIEDHVHTKLWHFIEADLNFIPLRVSQEPKID